MRIDETPGAAHYTPPIQPGPRGPGLPSYSQSGADGPEAEVEVSDQARLLQRAKQVAQATPDLRKERVAEIQRQIESGVYQVDSREVARRILEQLSAHR